jgi:hypothetical protein
LDLSFAAGSNANTSIIDTSIVDNSIDNIVLSVKDPGTSLFLDDDEISDDGTNFMILESEICGGDVGSETDNIANMLMHMLLLIPPIRTLAVAVAATLAAVMTPSTTTAMAAVVSLA